MAELTKPCEVCGTVFSKPYYCSRPEWSRRRFCSTACKAASQRGKPTWNKGKRVPRPSTYIPCRVCGRPTTQHGTERARLYGMLHCGRPECAEQSRQIKNDRLSASMKRAIQEGRKELGTWRDRGWESAEESTLRPWFQSIGWEAQYICRTGISEHPRWFRLDFALPNERLYVEIDGSVHRHRSRRKRDERRTAILESLGWDGLRISADDVTDDIEAVKQTILDWVAEQTLHPLTSN